LTYQSTKQELSGSSPYTVVDVSLWYTVIKMGNIPISVVTIAIVTMVPTILVLGSVGILEFGLVYSGLHSTIGWISITATLALALEVYALSISILMLVSARKCVWYSSVIFWILVIATAIFYSVFLHLFMFPTFAPMMSSAVCWALFDDKKVKSHFGFKGK